MDFSGFIKENPQMLGQAMGALGGGGSKEQGPPPPRDAQPGVDGVRQQQDTGDKGYDGFKNVVKTVASFWAGGPAAGAIVQGGVSQGMSGNGTQAPAQMGSGGGGGYQGSSFSPNKTDGGYSATAQQAQQQPWLQRWAGGYTGG